MTEITKFSFGQPHQRKDQQQQNSPCTLKIINVHFFFITEFVTILFAYAATLVGLPAATFSCVDYYFVDVSLRKLFLNSTIKQDMLSIPIFSPSCDFAQFSRNKSPIAVTNSSLEQSSLNAFFLFTQSYYVKKSIVYYESRHSQIPSQARTKNFTSLDRSCVLT